MADRDARKQFLRDPPERRLRRIAVNVAQIASCVTQRTSAAKLMAVLKETQTFCEWAVAGKSTAEVTSLLPQLKTALSTWQQVWPRLGAQGEFRQAVAREAGLWSRRLEALAKHV